MLHTHASQDNANIDEIDLRYYWALIRRYQKQLISLSAILSLIAILVVFTLTPIYRATTTILIQAEEINAVSIKEVVGVDYKRLSYYDTQYELLKSREIAELVVENLKLTTHPLFDPRQQEESFSLRSLIPVDQDTEELTEDEIERTIKASIVSAVQRSTTISPVKDTQIVKVSVDSESQKMAALISNAIAEAYIENHLNTKLQMTQKAAGWLQTRLADLKLQLRESEIDLQNFKEQEELVDLESAQALKTTELQQLAGKLIDVRQNKDAARNTYQQIKSLEGKPLDEIVAVSAIIKQPLIQSLKADESEKSLSVAELSKRYGDKHPKMTSAVAELSAAQLRLQKQVFDLTNAFEKEYQINLELEHRIEAAIKRTKAELQAINRQGFEFGKFNREVESNRKLYDMFLTRAKETVEAAGFSAAHARVIDQAITPQYPIKPKKKLIVVLTFILSIMLGVGLVLVHDMLDNTIKTPSDVEDKLKAVMLGLLPLIKTENVDSQGTYTGFIEDKTTGFSEAIRTIRTGILLSDIDREQHIMVVTSSIPNEGKSTIATNLAAALGQMHKTLIIDADMRRPTLAKTFSINTKQHGLSEIVSGSASIEECIKPSADGTFDILCAGTIPPNPLELLSSNKFKALIEELSKKYSNIVIDSPPTQSVSDSLVLSALSTGVIYVVKADSTSHTLASQGLARIKSTGAHTLGVILNQVNLDKASYYDYEYLIGYYDVYGYSSSDNT